MKKCPDCEREIDKLTFACEYCGRVEQQHQQQLSRQSSSPVKKPKNPSLQKKLD